MLAFSPLALPARADTRIPLSEGRHKDSAYRCLSVDPRKYSVDLLCFGRQGQKWTSNFRTQEQLPGDCLAALNGTFFSLRWSEPAAPLVYDGGSSTWTPHFKREYADGERAVKTLDRCYLAVFGDGRVVMGNSRGQTAEALRSQLHPRMLLGGGGWLVQSGRPTLSPATLRAEGFDERSGLRPESRVARTGLGIDPSGNLLLVTADSESLYDFADLLVGLHAREAIFLDCGSSTAMRIGQRQTGGHRPLPTWLVVRRLRSTIKKR